MTRNHGDDIINTIWNVESEIYEPSTKLFYSIEEVSRVLNIPRRKIAIYYKYGLITPHIKPGDDIWRFDDETILKLKRIEFLRSTYNLNLQVLKIIIDLIHEVEHLRGELRKLQMK